MKLFLINLDRQPERLQRMEHVFGELGLRFERISAIDGKLLSKEEVTRWQSVGSRELRAGETACFLSHRACWRRVVDESLVCAAIFEDDLHLSGDAVLFLGSDRWIPADADVVKIETKLQHARIDKEAAGRFGGRTLHRLRSRHAGAGGYVVTRRGAEKMLQMSERFGDPVDQFIFNPDLPSGAALTIYQLLPAVCVQDFVVKEPGKVVGLGSDLHDERLLRKPTGLKKIWREVKRPFLQLGGLIGRALTRLATEKTWVYVRFT